MTACVSAQAAQQRVAEAEEDQQRAEQQAAAQQEELQRLRSQLDSRRQPGDFSAESESQLLRENLRTGEPHSGLSADMTACQVRACNSSWRQS